MRPPISTQLQPSQPPLQAAFRDLHGSRLHGFALLLTVGDTEVASSTASRALANGAARAGELRHPERAAAWLRRRVVELLPRRAGVGRGDLGEARRGALANLGVPEWLAEALASLPLDERAALIAASVERFDPLDVEIIVGRREQALRSLQARARARYLEAAARALPPGGEPVPPGELARRISAQAQRTMGTGAHPQ